MANPVQLINILSNRTSAENIVCDDCKGAGEIPVFDPEMGHDVAECNTCLGSGYNQLGLILHNILQPPEDGYGPVELREALAKYRAQTDKNSLLLETEQSIREAEQAIIETQKLIDQAKTWISTEQKESRKEFGVNQDSQQKHTLQNSQPQPKRRIS